MPQHNIRIVVAYDGSSYLGWQKTRMGPSIQGTLQQTLEQILQHPITIEGASRTDTGVHAEGQSAHFFTSKAIDPLKLQHSLNKMLPVDIRVLMLFQVDDRFHSTHDCISKEYHYHLCMGAIQLPRYRFISWHCPLPMDIAAMQTAAAKLVGRHDFAAFCNASKDADEDTVRELYRLEVQTLDDNRLRLVIEGNRFLYKMVRNLAGTLVYVGQGKITASEIPLLLAHKKRQAMGVTAPAHGLTLVKVRY